MRWLLLIPFIGLLWVPFYNDRTPELLGFPFFYWYQFAWVPVTSLLIWIVYRSTARERVMTQHRLDRARRSSSPSSRSSPSWASWPRAGAGPRPTTHLDEWGLGGRNFGTWITWFLVGGDFYTAYTVIAVPALVYAVGAYGFFALPYTILVYPIVFLDHAPAVGRGGARRAT